MRILILGSTGYLGSKLVKALVEEGQEVICLKRKMSAASNLSDIINSIKLVDIDSLKGYLEHCVTPIDCMVNLACKYPRNVTDDMQIFDANLCVPLEVFLLAMRSGVSKFITIGTGLPNDFNTYSVSKHKFAEIIKWYGERQGELNKHIKICNVELENFYGKDEPKDRFIPATIDKLKRNERILLTEGNQKRDFIYIDDVIRILINLIYYSELPEYLDLPVGTGEGVAVKEIIQYLKELTKSKSELCFGAIEKRIHEPDSIADCKKLNELGFSAEYDWRSGFKKII